MMDPMRALEKIWKIVHTPSKKTNHKGAIDHYQADFDEIRKTIKPFIDAGFMNKDKDKDLPTADDVRGILASSPPQSEDQK